MGPGSQSEEVGNDGTVNSQACGPVVLVKGLPQGCRLFFRGRDDHEPKATGAGERSKLAELMAFVDVRRTFAGDVRGRAAEIDADQFQDAVHVTAMGGCDQSLGQPGTELLHFLAGEPCARRLTTGRIDQHGVLHRQGLWPQRNRALTGQSERPGTRLPQHVVRRGMEERVFGKLVCMTQSAQEFARGVAGQPGQHVTSQDLVRGHSVAGHILEDLTVALLACRCRKSESLGHRHYHN